MKIVLVCKRYYTNKDLIADKFGRLYHLPIQLARMGVSITVVALDYRSREAEEFHFDGVGFKVLPASFFNLPLLIPRIYKEVCSCEPDIVIASSDSHIGYISLQIARRLKAKFVFDVYDYYPVFQGNRLPGMKSMFQSAVRQADLVLTPSKVLEQKLAVANSKTLLVENGVDRSLFSPMDINTARNVLSIDTTIPVVGYFGSITSQRGPLLIEACRRLREKRPELMLLLAGRVTDVGLSELWINYLGELPQDDIPVCINACDVVVVPYGNDVFNSMAGACKIAEYLACERPVVATRVGGHEVVFQNTPTSLCEVDVDSMSEAIEAQLASPQIARFPDSFEWSRITSVLLSILRETTGYQKN